MDLINATKLITGYTLGLQPSGRESIVVVAKGTFNFPQDDKPPTLAAKQVPLVMADVFTGEPGFSAPLYEADFVPVKHKCDVLLNGSAYAPRGEPTKRVTVSLSVGAWRKSFDVVGKRTWQVGFMGPSLTDPEPFTVQPISYDVAFGGIDNSLPDPARHRYYLENHAGVGFFTRGPHPSLIGRPGPHTEESGAAVSKPGGPHRPMAFGSIGRAWQPRVRFVGTYDQAWQDNRFPFLPDDFDERYFQAAPPDQQVDFLQGGEIVELRNLTPEGTTRFTLPKLEVPMEFFYNVIDSVKVESKLDTVVIEPDLRRFTLCWRGSIELKRNIFEIPTGLVGRMPSGWYKARRLGKEFHVNLDAWIKDKQAAEEQPDDDEAAA